MNDGGRTHAGFRHLAREIDVKSQRSAHRHRMHRGADATEFDGLEIRAFDRTRTRHLDDGGDIAQ